MPTPHAEKIIKQAQNGEKIVAADRRHAVAFYMATETPTNQEMADLFQVTERVIRLDRKWIREQRSRLIREEDIGLVVADLAMALDKEARDIEASKAKCTKGTRAYLEHCKASLDIRLKIVKALQELGFYPKNLGNMTLEKFEYKSIVSKDGSVDTRPDTMEFDVTDAEFEVVESQKSLPAPEIKDEAQLPNND